MTELVRKLNNFFTKDIWYIDTRSLDRSRAFLIKTLRLIYAFVREFSERELPLRATSLVYTTLLSLVPLLAFSFSVLKGFGVHNQIEPFLSQFLAPLGAEADKITRNIIDFVENVDVRVLGSLGLATLIYTVISLVQKMEEALNHIWKIEKPRSFTRRFSDYLTIILIGPVLLFTAVGLTASVMSNAIVQKLISIEPLGTVIYLLGKLVPYVFVTVAFTFIYMLMPNTKVRFGSALLGGLIAGVIWQTAGWGFALFITSSARYPAIYSSFAVIILFMIWLYVNWLILLIGAEISFCHQNLKFLTLKKEVFNLSNRLKEKLSFLIMYLIGHNYYYNKERWTLDSLVDYLGLPHEPIQNTLRQLEGGGLILETGDNPPAFIPAKDIETIKLKEILDTARRNKDDPHSIERRFFSIPEVDPVIKRIDESIEHILGEETVKDLILQNRKET
ncbi:MAG TPA: YihY/virulence factor BrkB family protein, partial [Thermodesulfobacteriota bacterium]|nr:YihY/virulence factor BrkB family protein [Thermodesulfobacteriota bacterium]